MCPIIMFAIIALVILLPIFIFRKKSRGNPLQKNQHPLNLGSAHIVMPNQILEKDKIDGPVKINIFEVSPNLNEELISFKKKETKIIFYIFKQNKSQENYQYLLCDWLKEKLQIKYAENNNKLEVDYIDSDDSYNSESLHMIKLLFGEKEITFNIHILLHQKNIFNLFIDINDEKAFSLEKVFYSKDKTKFNRIVKTTNDIMNKKLNCEDYKDQYFIRCNYINITKNYIKDILSDYGGKFDEKKEKIFTKQNPNLFLNVLFGKEKKEKAKLHLFLNDEIPKYEMNDKDYVFLDLFYNKFIESNYYESSENNANDYFNNIYTTLESEYQDIVSKDDNNKEDNEIKVDNKIQDDNNNNGDDNIENDYNNNKDEDNSISDEIKEYENEFEKKLEKYIHYADKKILYYLSYLLSIKNKLKEEHLILCEKICLFALCLIESPYIAINRFYELKDKFYKIDNISLYDKLKIMISLKTFLTLEKNNHSFIDIVEYNKLTSESPFIQGYLFYKQIVENLEQDSLLTFIYNQINSGKGKDYMSDTNIDCYKLKYIPLSIIKSHLLFNYKDNKYFFIYEKNSSEHAYTEGYSKDIFYNLSSIKFNRLTPYSSKKSNLNNDSTKIGLLHLHENSHIKFRITDSFNMKSPRGVIQSDLKLFKNDFLAYNNNNNDLFNTIKHGESGKALEYILFGDNDAISQLLKHNNLEKLKDYKLYIENNNKKLTKIKDEILKQQTFGFLNKINYYKASSANVKIKKLNLKKNIYDTIVLTDN